MYELHVISVSYVTEEVFMTALRRSVARMEPWLDDLQLQYTVAGNTITIQSDDPRAFMTACEDAWLTCNIKGFFCDAQGRFFPEFAGLCWNKLPH